MNPGSLDQFDANILAELQRDARISVAELARRIHLSQPAVRERVQKLESAGIIKSFRTIVDARSLGYGIRAIMRVGRCDSGRIERLIARTPEVVTAFNITGEDTWMLEIAVVDVEHLDSVVSKFCTLAVTSTSIILKALREHHPLVPASQLAAHRGAALAEAAAK
jgi:Lrp/AsnC family transcriptional regulator, leucine-responsive regulatory protein